MASVFQCVMACTARDVGYNNLLQEATVTAVAYQMKNALVHWRVSQISQLFETFLSSNINENATKNTKNIYIT